MADTFHATDDHVQSAIETEPPRFFVEMGWYGDVGRSFRATAQGRFCSSCQARIGSPNEERVAVTDEKTGRVTYEVRSAPYGDQPLAVIRGCCSKQRAYITPETPLLEAVFRVFLANGNQPATIERLREQLGDWISLRDRPHGYSPELIARMIASDRRYGIREFALSDK